MPVPSCTAILKEKKMLTADVMLLSFGVFSSFPFQAGQYVMVKVTSGSAFRLKPYSILSPPSEKGKIDLCAKLIPGGFASEAFRELSPGRELEFRGPLGHFTFEAPPEDASAKGNPSANDNWFICNGTGVTPFYSMLQEHVPQFPEKKFTLIFGVRSQSDLFLHEELKALQDKHSNFTFIPTLSRENWEGSMGRVQQHLPGDLQNKTFYICGLKEMVLETQELLEKKGVPKERIKVERYT